MSFCVTPGWDGGTEGGGTRESSVRLAGRKTSEEQTSEELSSASAWSPSYRGVPQNALEPNLNTTTTTQISSRTAKLSGEKIMEPRAKKNLTLVRGSWNNPGPQSKRTIDSCRKV